MTDFLFVSGEERLAQGEGVSNEANTAEEKPLNSLLQRTQYTAQSLAATMTEAFMGYSEDFEQCRDDAMSDIRAIPKARSPGERNDLTERAQGNISEAERYVRAP